MAPNFAGASLIFATPFGWDVVASALFGVTLAILHYEWAHYVAPIPHRPRTAPGRWMKAYQLRRHFISERHWFGVSNPSMDWLVGTFNAPADVERGGTTRTLGR